MSFYGYGDTSLNPSLNLRTMGLGAYHIAWSRHTFLLPSLAAEII